MKILQEKYPKGSYKGQKSDGRYIDENIYRNLEILADNIVRDMTFLGVCYSSTLEVGTGKSVFCTQLGEAWSEIMNRKHGTSLEFTQQNLVWRPDELIKRAFEVPRYSFILLDEWEDASYWSKLGMTLRQFFRKCRQLNLFIMIIIPNFFQLPINYAVSRSAFAIDVRFQDGFERGYFYFYSFESKKKLYVKGKRDHNYHVVSADLRGRFLDGYGLPEEEYRKAKLKDMMEYDKNEKKPPTEVEIKAKMLRQLKDNLPEITNKRWAEALGVAESTLYRWMSEEIKGDNDTVSPPTPLVASYNSHISNKVIVMDEDSLEPDELQDKPILNKVEPS